MNTKKRIYLDYAASTPLDPRVFRVMKPFLETQFGNPGSIHREGVVAKGAIDSARKNIADTVRAHPDEIIFTSGGTESNNLAVFGSVAAREKENMPLSKMHFVTSAIEHPSIMNIFYALERRGASVSYVGVDAGGTINHQELKKALKKETVLISILYANSEIGAIQPISEIAKTVRLFRKTNHSKFPLLHTDASQSPLYLDMNIQKMNVDFLTLDGHKIYGPKGVGALFKKRDVVIEPLFYGGGQEYGFRPGTENVPGIIGLSEALTRACAEKEKESRRMTLLRDYFIQRVLASIPRAELNGNTRARLANNVNFSFVGMESEWIVLQLDAAGIAAGSKSACLSKAENKSYVIAALHKSDAHAQSSVRFTLGKSTIKKDIDYTLKQLARICDKTAR